jgi:hypothetical protein
MTLQQPEMKSQQSKDANNYSLERVAELTSVLSSKTEVAINQIDRINGETQVLAINALIEASRAGEVGKAFSVVAEEMSKLSKKIEDTTENMRRESLATMGEMGKIIDTQITNIRGVRLSDLALTNIDLVDRSLYERSCDVRWWAKDGSLVEALARKDKEGFEHAAKRLGVILDSYTVYHDLVLCDADGMVAANGRPDQFKSMGKNQKDTPWFKSALEANAKDAFGFQAVHRSPLVGDQLAVVFSCAIRENSQEDGKIIGVLGVVFNWEGLSQRIIESTPLSAEERNNCRICIVDSEGTLLADSRRKVLEGRIQFPGLDSLLNEKKGFVMTEYENENSCVGHALSPGYETYASGWHSLLIQKLKKTTK